MSFMDAIKKELGTLPYNKSITENGAVGYNSTMNPILDMNFKISSYRNRTNVEIISDFNEAFNYDSFYALKWLFFVRDAREGVGERRLFRVIMKHLASVKKDIAIKLLPIIAEYGRWDDVITLYNTAVRKEVINLIKDTLYADMKNLKDNKSISLLAKWMPSVNTSSEETKRLGRAICKDLGLDEKSYRKMLAVLRDYIKVVETQMSAQNWNEINYEAVPSKANLNYRNAFLKHDEERRMEYLKALTNCETKINSSVVFPHEIVTKYNLGYYSGVEDNIDATLEAMWKALPDYGITDTLVVADGSGSMTCSIDNGRTTALSVANALAIYCAQHNQGEFKNKYITFSHNPEYVEVNADTLIQNVITAYHHNEVSDTNIEKVFQLILDTAITNNIRQEEMPKNILIISDMEFNQGTSIRNIENSKALFDAIEERFEEYGYILPRLIFWNVDSRTNTIPLTENELGVVLVSGFSTAILKMVISGKLDPWECLKETLDSERYKKVEAILC